MSTDIKANADDASYVCMAITAMLCFKGKTRKALRKQEVCLYNVLMVKDKRKFTHFAS